MSGIPVLLRVRLAFENYPVGYVFHSPPLPGTLRQEWISRGFLEVVKDGEDAKAATVKPRELGRKRQR